MGVAWLTVVTAMTIGVPFPPVVGIWASGGVPQRAGHADPHRLALLLRRHGFSVRLLSVTELASPQTLTPQQVALVLLPYGAFFPAEAVENFRRYLKAGGRFISLGGFAFDEIIGGDETEGSRWRWEKRAHERAQVSVTAGKLRIVVPDEVPVDWHRLSAVVPVRRGWRYLLAGKVRTEGVRDGYGAYLAADYYDAAGNRLAFQQTQLVRRTEGWRELGVVLRIPEDAAAVTVSAILHGRGVAEFCDIALKPVVNARFGDAGDWMRLDPHQFALFDPSFRIDGAVTLHRSANGQLVWRSKEPLSGYAAVGLIGSNDPVNPQAWARLMPVLIARDRYGRYLGPAFAMVHHFAGPYAGSAWAFCGIESHDLTKVRPFQSVLVGVIRHLLRGVFLHGLRPEWWCYRKGEVAEVIVQVRNDGIAPETVTVWIEIAPMPQPLKMGDSVARTERGVTLSPREQATVTVRWRIPDHPAPLYALHALLLSSSRPIDELWSGFCVWDESLLRAGAPVTWRDNALCEWDGRGWRRRFWLGTNQTGVLFAPEAAWENPLRWELEFAVMRRMGLRVLRILHISPFAGDLEKPTETFWRRYDALVLMAHRHGLVLMPCLHDWMGVSVDDTALRKQCAFVRQVGARYKEAPRIVWDLENEAMAGIRDLPDLRRRFNDWLQRCYGDEAKLQVAWGEPVRLGAIPFAPHDPRDWTDLKFRDLQHFRRYLVGRWVEANVQALREGGAKHPVTDEIDWKVCGDHYEASRWLTFTNLHYYGDRSPAAIATYLKFHERLHRNQGLAVGEFGARDHPSFRFSGWGYAPTEEVLRHFTNMPLLTMALGGTMALNWDFKDMEACFFPWGLVHQHGVFAAVRTKGQGQKKGWQVEAAVKGAGKVMAALARFLERCRFPSTAAEESKVALVLPDEHLLGAEGEVRWSGLGPAGKISTALFRAIEAMLRLKGTFRVVREWEIAESGRGLDCAVALFPIPFVWRDDTFAAVKRFVAGGGIALITGDFTFDPDRKRTRTERLKELLGVDFLDGVASPLASEGMPPVQCRGLDTALGLTSWQGKPCVRMGQEVRGGGWVLAVTERREPVIVARQVGKGMVVFCADAPELRDTDETVRLYGALLKWVGVQGADERGLVVLGDGQSLFVAANPSDRFEAIEHRLSDQRIRITVPPKGTALVVVKGKERGALWAGAWDIGEKGRWRPLARSGGEVLLWWTPKVAWFIPMHPGNLHLRWGHPKASVTVSDLLTGKVLWRFTVKASAQTLSLTVPPDLVLAEWRVR